MTICPALFHTVYPYAFTVLEDGWFAWVKRGDGVIVQCPKGKVWVKVYEDKFEVVYADKCPKHTTKDAFALQIFKPGC